jgi:hypothetical protein
MIKDDYTTTPYREIVFIDNYENNMPCQNPERVKSIRKYRLYQGIDYKIRIFYNEYKQAA